MMRALAHPARIAIWQHLGLEGPATATECAAVAGLSPSACSYHLRTLARYGFVEEDRSHAADGRERPWRVKIVAQSAVGTNYDVLHLTTEELNTLRRRLIELFGDYRRLSRDERPAGARRVHVTVDLVPWFEPDDVGGLPTSPPPGPRKARPSHPSLAGLRPTGIDSVLSVTLIQRWAPPAMLGRVWGLLTLASVGSFPVATFIAGLLVHHLGPTPIFPISGALLALSMAYGLAQREFRDFGVVTESVPAPADA
jgi:hypothetical protein